jgi:type I restriction enzyme M protein
LLGDIPDADIEALHGYWKVYPTLKSHLFGKSNRDNFSALKVAKEEIKQSIFSHPEFVTYTETVNTVFNQWKTKNTPVCKAIDAKDQTQKVYSRFKRRFAESLQ